MSDSQSRFVEAVMRRKQNRGVFAEAKQFARFRDPATRQLERMAEETSVFEVLTARIVHMIGSDGVLQNGRVLNCDGGRAFRSWTLDALASRFFVPEDPRSKESIRPLYLMVLQKLGEFANDARPHWGLDDPAVWAPRVLALLHQQQVRDKGNAKL
jgi:hypothetical protein